MINKIDLRIINLNKLNRTTTMDEWCDDFNVKVGDKVPANTTNAPRLPEITRVDTSWNIPDWSSNQIGRVPWLTDPKVCFAPSEQIIVEPLPTNIPEEEPLPTNIPTDTQYSCCNVTKSYGFKQELDFSLASTDAYSDPIRYLDILDIFKYVTLGGHISDEYIDSFCEYIYNANSDFKNRKTCKKTYFSVAGHQFERYMVMYKRTDYLELVRLCSDWAQCNPEKVVIY